MGRRMGALMCPHPGINAEKRPATESTIGRVIYELVLAIAPEINYSVGCI
jgi:hypothetical protein